MELFVLWMAFGLIAALIGSSRGGSGLGWFFGGLLLGPIGIILACFAGVTCPQCRKRISKKATVCPHCRSELKPKDGLRLRDLQRSPGMHESIGKRERLVALARPQKTQSPSRANRIGKRERLAALARHRRDNVFPGYRGIGEYHSGAYECDFVSPYTKSAWNLNADIMLVLQDWCSDEFLQKPVDSNLVTLGHDPKLPTNRNLKSLLSTHFGIGLEQTYTTNLFPFIKYGAMSKSVPVEDLEKAAETYTVPEIEIVEPRLVVCLGLAVYRAIRKSFGLAPAGNLEMAIASPFRIGDAQFWAQSSPGALGRANRNRGGVDRVAEDWRRMADAVQ